MNKPFAIDSQDEKHLFESFELSSEEISDAVAKYNELLTAVPYQFLAHIMRTIEVYVRSKYKGSEYFRITCRPTSNEKLEMLAYAQLSHDNYTTFHSFNIIYYSGYSNGSKLDFDEVQQRVVIAHEIGHLISQLMNAPGKQPEDHATLYGILIMLHKHTCKHTKKTASSRKAIIDDFKLMKNRKNAIYNKS